MYQLLNTINIAIGVEVTILDHRDITITSLMTTRAICTRRGAVRFIVDARIYQIKHVQVLSLYILMS